MKKILAALNFMNSDSKDDKRNQPAKKYKKKRDLINGEVIPGRLFDLYAQALPNSNDLFENLK